MDVTQEGGYVSGIVHDDENKIINWCYKNGVNDQTLQSITGLPKPIAFLESVEVEDDYRGKGLGTELVYAFMDEVYKANSIVLIADLGQSSFLEKWYQSLDFKTIGSDTAGNPVMLFVGL
jgi:GNAT superfamily N-acetyltransferase